MINYCIFETTPYLKDLDKNFEGRNEKIKIKLREFVYLQLKISPHYGSNIKKLKNYKPETWRYRVGDYRLFYEIDEQEKIVYLIAIDSRGNSY